jgi:NAD(P)-dependent dehydrogenase (short-subunit alcohol dehydrogenase family)
MAAYIPLRRPGAVGEAAAATVWPLSPAASYVTAAILGVTEAAEASGS